MEAVKQGSACVGLVSENYAVLAALKRLVPEEFHHGEMCERPHVCVVLVYRSPSELAEYQKKVFRVDDHAGIAISGLTADARSLSK